MKEFLDRFIVLHKLNTVPRHEYFLNQSCILVFIYPTLQDPGVSLQTEG